jgi:tetratricopeptide (TPR) repeat protein
MGSYAHGNILLIKDEMAGRFEVYGDWLRRNLDRNPLDTDQISELALYQQEAGQLEQSAANVRKLLELNPAYAGAQALYGLTLLLQGKHAEALAAAQRESDEASKLQALTCIYWAMSRRADSDEALGALERGFAARNDYMIAAAHAYRGDADSAFVWLDRAYQQRRGSLEGLRTDVLFRRLHDDPRFSAFVRKAKLVE